MMTLDVSPAISRLARSATRTTQARDSYDDVGNLIEGEATVIQIKAAIMNIGPNELKDLPEGIRSEADSICWTSSPIENDDTIEQDGETYRVMDCDNRKIGNYYRAVVGKTDDGN